MDPDTFSYRSADGRNLPAIAGLLAGAKRVRASSYSSMAWASTFADTTTLPARSPPRVLKSMDMTIADTAPHSAANDEPGQLGPNGWTALVDDLNLVIAQAKSDHPGLPVVMVAHSMGSFATQQFLLDHGADVDAVALTGTAALDLLEPAMDLSSDLDLSAFNTPFQPARTDFDWLSRDESVVDAYLADPLCGFGIDAASPKDMFAGARRLADPDEVARMPHDLPMYVAVGSRDPVNGGAHSAVGTGGPLPRRRSQ